MATRKKAAPEPAPEPEVATDSITMEIDRRTRTPSAPDRPTIGSIVHYVDGYYYQHHAAIVTKVYGDVEPVLALAIFGQPGLGTVSDDRVRYDASGTAPATWHWPEQGK